MVASTQVEACADAELTGPRSVDECMIKYKTLGFVCYAVTNMKRARKFYEGALGLKPSRVFSKNFVEYDIGSGTVAVGCAPGQWKPSRDGTVAALEVADFDRALAHVKKKKVAIATGPLDMPSCRMFVVRDPDGNKIALHRRKRVTTSRKK